MAHIPPQPPVPRPDRDPGTVLNIRVSRDGTSYETFETELSPEQVELENQRNALKAFLKAEPPKELSLHEFNRLTDAVRVIAKLTGLG